MVFASSSSMISLEQDLPQEESSPKCAIEALLIAWFSWKEGMEA
jgi:hypothetical protein